MLHLDSGARDQPLSPEMSRRTHAGACEIQLARFRFGARHEIGEIFEASWGRHDRQRLLSERDDRRERLLGAQS